MKKLLFLSALLPSICFGAANTNNYIPGANIILSTNGPDVRITSPTQTDPFQWGSAFLSNLVSGGSGGFIANSNGTGTNLTVYGTNTAQYFVGDGSGLTHLPAGETAITNAVASIYTNGVPLSPGSTTNITFWGIAGGTNTDGKVDIVLSPPGGSSDGLQWGSVTLTNVAALPALTNSQPGSPILSNLVVAPLTNANPFQPASQTLTNMALLPALTNSQPGSSILSNLVVAPLTNASGFQPGSAILSNASVTGVLTNGNLYQPATAILSNLVVSPLTNASGFQPGSAILSNIAVTGAITNGSGYQPATALLSNLVVAPLTNASGFQPATAILSNLVVSPLTNGAAYQPASAVLSNAVVTGIVTNGDLVNSTNNLKIDITNIATTIAWLGGTFTNAVYSDAQSASNGPAANEIPNATWVRNLFAGAGASYYSTTNVCSFTNTDALGPVYVFTTNIPAYSSRTYTAPTNGQYIGAVAITNRIMYLGANVTVNAHLENSGGTGSKSISLHPEIYVSYDGTNWFGDWDAPNQSIASGSTNLYSWICANPAYAATNSIGMFLERRLKIGTQSGNPNVILHIGTNYPSHITLPGQSLSAGSAFLAANQTFTGTNTFAQPIVGSGASLTNLTSAWTDSSNAVYSGTNALWGTASNMTYSGTNNFWGTASNQVYSGTNSFWGTASNMVYSGTNSGWGTSSNQVYSGTNSFWGTASNMTYSGTNSFWGTSSNMVYSGTNGFWGTASNMAYGATNSYNSGPLAGGTNAAVAEAGRLAQLSSNAAIANIQSSNYPSLLTVTGVLATARFTPYSISGTNITLDPANGNLQSWDVTAQSWVNIVAGNTNFTESIRFEISGSNVVNWTNTYVLTNTALEFLTNQTTVLLLDHPRGTNAWWLYRLR